MSGGTLKDGLDAIMLGMSLSEDDRRYQER